MSSPAVSALSEGSSVSADNVVDMLGSGGGGDDTSGCFSAHEYGTMLGGSEDGNTVSTIFAGWLASKCLILFAVSFLATLGTSTLSLKLQNQDIHSVSQPSREALSENIGQQSSVHKNGSRPPSPFTSGIGGSNNRSGHERRHRRSRHCLPLASLGLRYPLWLKSVLERVGPLMESLSRPTNETPVVCILFLPLCAYYMARIQLARTNPEV